MSKLEYKPKLIVEGYLTLDENDIRVLEHILGYDLASIIRDKVTKKYSIEELTRVLHPIRDQLRQIIHLAGDQRNNLFGG